jgi:hypothetical protein
MQISSDDFIQLSRGIPLESMVFYQCSAFEFEFVSLVAGET